MESLNPPSKIARLADSRIGPTSWDNAWNMKTNGSIGKEGSTPSGLGLGLELGCGSSDQLGCAKCSGFTFLQLQELEHQTLIYKYMEAGLPVPTHLMHPLWKSVANSFGGVNGGIYQLYPSFLGCSSLYFDYRSSMDPEPGRCRRTDGKKWRCSKDVVPDQKYCERHMHRGRQRSRKFVEASQLTATTSTGNNTRDTDVFNSNTNLSISLPLSSNSSNVSPILGFSPKSVLQGGTHKTEPSL